MIPKFYRKLVAQSLSENFRKVVKLQTVETARPSAGQLLVKAKYAGVNASDINWTAGRYIPGVKPPLDTGFEGLGEVVEVGEECGGFSAGDHVSYMAIGSFSEYVVVPAKLAFPVPRADPSFIPLLVSGLTASICLERCGELKRGEKVLVTAAAGGTGQFAVQLAKMAGCHVIGTCSSDEKVDFLRSIGCDRPINYKKESLRSVLSEEYKQGVDVVYESVGGDMFNTCLKSLATGGRLLIIGFISSYRDGSFASRPSLPITQILLSKSASIRGFFLNNYTQDFARHYGQLVGLLTAGKLRCHVDQGGGAFSGLEGVLEAVDYLYSGKSAGKVVVDIAGGAAVASKL